MPCRPDNPLPCDGRKAARPGLWYSEDAKTWFWATLDFLIAVKWCPYCGGVLPMMGGKQATEALLRKAIERETLGDPEE